MKLEIGNKTVGILEERYFTKYVKESKHLMKMMDAWGIDWKLFNTHLDDGYITVIIIDTETDKIYTADAWVWRKHGKIKSFGHGEQIFLARKYFDVQDGKQRKLI